MDNKTINKLYSIDTYAFNKLGAKSGGEIRDNEDMLNRYQAIVISKLGEPDAQYNREIYDTLEDNNYHLLNETLTKYGYYNCVKTFKLFREEI